MELKIRKANLEDLNKEGIPKDFAQLREYWNHGVATKEGVFKYIPRRKEITLDEIRNLFIPAIKEGRSINLLAESEGRVVGAITAIYDANKTEYEHRGDRKPGDIGESVDPRVENYQKILTALFQGLEKELGAQNRVARAVFPIEDTQSIEAMRSLGYKETTQNHPPYESLSLSGKGAFFTVE